MRLHFLLACLWLCATVSVFAQNDLNTPALTSVLPPAPNAYQLTKYAGLPISFSTGSPAADIPLVPLKQGTLQLNVQLSYQGGKWGKDQ